MTGMPIPRARGASIKDAPDHHDAELVLRLYELRREATMREARRYIAAEFWPATLDDVLAIVRTDHPGNAAWRQVGSYWEMAYGMARHGIVNPDYLAEHTGEGMLLFAKVHSWLAEIRAASYPHSFRNAEWLATHCDTAREQLESFRRRVEKALAARRGA
ncbi:MAG TPA: hypothetical protein VF187_02695 [Gemmatimonadales bacterium]